MVAVEVVLRNFPRRCADWAANITPEMASVNKDRPKAGHLSGKSWVFSSFILRAHGVRFSVGLRLITRLSASCSLIVHNSVPYMLLKMLSSCHITADTPSCKARAINACTGGKLSWRTEFLCFSVCTASRGVKVPGLEMRACPGLLSNPGRVLPRPQNTLEEPKKESGWISNWTKGQKLCAYTGLGGVY